MWKEIVWSVDPYQKDARVWNHAAALCHFLASKTDVKIEPVYVSTPAELRIMTSFEIPPQKRMYEVSTKAVNESLKKARIKNLKKPHIIVNRTAFSTTESVKSLTQYVFRSGAAALVLGTHSKTGLERFFLGSFAETLLYHSKTPVFLVGPKMRKKAVIKSIVFATDFSSQSKKAYRSLLEFASKIGARLHLVNFVEDNSRYMNPFDSLMSGTGSALLETALRDQTRSSKKTLQRWAKEAEKLKIKTSIYSQRTPSSIGEEILRFAKSKKADLVAVGTQSGPIRAQMGSVARHIVRKSELPVWIAPRYA